MKIDFSLPGFAARLISWFDENQRELPWRVSKDPYKIWISEIMLQQTRVEAVIAYFNRWVKKWPTVSALAYASEIDVLNAWQGLGYYSRAKNILKSAIIIQNEYAGVFPNEVSEIIKLPGIGRYTAGAIASLAFGKKEAIVDGNVARVYARIFERSEVINEAKSQNFYYQIAENLLPNNNISSFNQGLMELGALICIPQTPRCNDCPVSKFCKANANHTTDLYPIRKKAPKTEKIYRLLLLIQKRGQIFMVQRATKGVFHGMWELPGFSISNDIVAYSVLKEEISENLHINGKVVGKVKEFSHTFTKYKETVFVYSFTPADSNIQLTGAWVTFEKSKKLPMGSVQKKIINYVFQQKD
jgi:A/G-specific adenine glycosylase